ncbi:fumarylacetoacetate hydrolase family protein [Lysobacter sp. HA18]
MDRWEQGDDSETWEIARRFVHARQHAHALPDFPGTRPPWLDAGYEIQDAAIALWPSAIAGWKVGKIPDAWVAQLGEDRLVGPIFSAAVQRASSAPSTFDVIPGGFAAVEAEFVYRIGEDAPPNKLHWTEDEALAVVDAMHVGVEFAGSPLATINDLGPTVVVSDFGNNTGLVIGPEIPEWRDRDEPRLTCEVRIDGIVVGQGAAASIAGGTGEALRFALARCARRGMPLRAGQWISTGAATGIHDIREGQHAEVDFGPLGRIDCIAIPASKPTA